MGNKGLILLGCFFDLALFWELQSKLFSIDLIVGQNL